MAMRTASPWWASLVFGVGLLFVLLGERLFGHLPGVRMRADRARRRSRSSAITGLRACTMLRTTGARRARRAHAAALPASACCSRSCSTR